MFRVLFFSFKLCLKLFLVVLHNFLAYRLRNKFKFYWKRKSRNFEPVTSEPVTCHFCIRYLAVAIEFEVYKAATYSLKTSCSSLFLIDSKSPQKFICYVNINLWSHWISISSIKPKYLRSQATMFCRNIAIILLVVRDILTMFFLFLFHQKETFRSSLFNKVLHQ